jgi:hypothetical protein
MTSFSHNRCTRCCLRAAGPHQRCLHPAPWAAVRNPRRLLASASAVWVRQACQRLMLVLLAARQQEVARSSGRKWWLWKIRQQWMTRAKWCALERRARLLQRTKCALNVYHARRHGKTLHRCPTWRSAWRRSEAHALGGAKETQRSPHNLGLPAAAPARPSPAPAAWALVPRRADASLRVHVGCRQALSLFVTIIHTSRNTQRTP